MGDVELINVTKMYNSVAAVADISMSIPAGCFFSMLGPSGCGKSTTLRMIGGFETVDRGTLRIAGQDVANVPPNRRPTNMVFQRWALFPHMTIYDNVAFGLQMEGVAKPEIRRRVGEALEMVGLGKRASDKPGKLSGGQMQRVALVRALVKRPKVLLLDEPLGALDLKLRVQLQRELKAIQRQVGLTFIYVTHDQSEALLMSDQVAVMSEGRVEQIGSPKEIYDRPQSPFVADFIGGTNFLDVEVEKEGKETVLVRSGPLRFEAERLGSEQASSGVVCIRFERIRIGEQAAQMPFHWEATVLGQDFVGSSIQYQVKLAQTDTNLTIQVPYDATAAVFQVGANVTVGWTRSSAGYLGAKSRIVAR